MAASDMVDNGNRNMRRIVHTALSLVAIVFGIALLIYMITVEDEPGALPLAMVIGGIAWFIIARMRLKPRAAWRHTVSSPRD